jgi:FixJ family two-component response regulator
MKGEAPVSTVYVLESDPAERCWLASALNGIGDARVFLDAGAALLDRLPLPSGDCLVCGTEAGGTTAVELVRTLRQRGEALPVVVIGPITAFRAAVDIARLEATDFLERPVSIGRLRSALRRMGCDAAAAAVGARR